MAKEVRLKCNVCKAKHKESFMVPLLSSRGRVCEACACEYNRIFRGFQSRNDRKPPKNPLFEVFRRGWENAEKEEGLTPLPIPQSIKDYYDMLLFEKGMDAPAPTREEILRLYYEGTDSDANDRVSEDS